LELELVIGLEEKDLKKIGLRMRKKNLFITFEGIDGSGKDTQMHNLIKHIRGNKEIFGDKYTNITVTREPTKYSKWGREISEKLKEDKFLSVKETTNLYIKDRIEHTKLIKEQLKTSFVLCSRYDLSTLSYQMTQGEIFDNLYNFHKYNEINGCLIPDITIVFLVNPEEGFRRAKKRGEKKEFFEKLEFQKLISKNLDFCINEIKKRQKKRKVIIINANNSIENIELELVEKLKKYNF
jgi:dTMP kinase